MRTVRRFKAAFVLFAALFLASCGDPRESDVEFPFGFDRGPFGGTHLHNYLPNGRVRVGGVYRFVTVGQSSRPSEICPKDVSDAHLYLRLEKVLEEFPISGNPIELGKIAVLSVPELPMSPANYASHIQIQFMGVERTWIDNREKERLLYNLKQNCTDAIRRFQNDGQEIFLVLGTISAKKVTSMVTYKQSIIKTHRPNLSGARLNGVPASAIEKEIFSTHEAENIIVELQVDKISRPAQ